MDARWLNQQPLAFTTERICRNEFRSVLSVAAAGTTALFLNKQINEGTVEILEIALWCEAAQSIQLLIDKKPDPLTPVFTFASAQGYIDAGVLLRSGETLNLVAGNSSKIDVLIRWRQTFDTTL